MLESAPLRRADCYGSHIKKSVQERIQRQEKQRRCWREWIPKIGRRLTLYRNRAKEYARLLNEKNVRRKKAAMVAFGR